MALKYDNPILKMTVTLGGPLFSDGGTTGAPRSPTCPKDTVSATSTDAINGSQLYTLDQKVNSIQIGSSIKYFHANSTKTDSLATGTDSVAAGPASVATGSGSVAGGTADTDAVNVRQLDAAVNLAN